MKKLDKIILSFLLILSISTNAQDVLTKIQDFGSNPGNLNMKVYIPSNLDNIKASPMVVALHGCSQNATTIAIQSGWNDLADEHGIIMLYPEQRRMNNGSNCFNWYRDKDSNGEEGEIWSIKQMMDYMTDEYNIDTNQMYCYGLSAGAAMSVNLLSNFPESFDAGAIFAGGPYGAATNGGEALKLMMNAPDKEPEEWAGLVTSKHDSTTNYPKVIIGHGTKDNVVDYRNSLELVEQWTSVHGIGKKEEQVETSFAGNENVVRRSYLKDNDLKVAFYTFNFMGHVLPVAPGNGDQQGGTTGMFTKDKNFFSTYYVAKDFGLIK